jgi:hypothetical protein
VHRRRVLEGEDDVDVDGRAAAEYDHASFTAEVEAKEEELTRWAAQVYQVCDGNTVPLELALRVVSGADSDLVSLGAVGVRRDALVVHAQTGRAVTLDIQTDALRVRQVSLRVLVVVRQVRLVTGRIKCATNRVLGSAACPRRPRRCCFS